MRHAAHRLPCGFDRSPSFRVLRLALHLGQQWPPIWFVASGTDTGPSCGEGRNTSDRDCVHDRHRRARVGSVDSLNNPGGNLTGVMNLSGGLGPKRLQVIRELVPNAKKVGLLTNIHGCTRTLRANVQFFSLAPRAPSIHDPMGCWRPNFAVTHNAAFTCCATAARSSKRRSPGMVRIPGLPKHSTGTGCSLSSDQNLWSPARIKADVHTGHDGTSRAVRVWSAAHDADAGLAGS
jgi:hypothetical protein